MLQRNTPKNEKADSDVVRRQNRRIVLDALRHQGNLARVELGRITGLSPASITAISAQLIDDRIIEEVAVPMGAELTGKRGRPIVRLALTAKATYVVAVNISIDTAHLVLADFRGAIVAEQVLKLPTYHAEQARFGEALATAIAAFLKAHEMPLHRVCRIGLAVQGLADSVSGSIVWSPTFSSRNVPMSKPIERALGIPVQIGNDANMMAEGYRETSGHGVTAAIVIGYGVGMGLIINGEIFHGATGAAAEFGHMNHIPHGMPCRCGRRGCVEAYVADYAILRSAKLLGEEAGPAGIEPQRMQAAVTAAEHGDPALIRAFETAGEALGFGIARLIAILNPDRIIIAGTGMRALRLMEPAMRQALQDGAFPELRRNLDLELIAFDTDLIIRGTIGALLRVVDHEVFAAGPVAPRDEGALIQ